MSNTLEQVISADCQSIVDKVLWAPLQQVYLEAFGSIQEEGFLRRDEVEGSNSDVADGLRQPNIPDQLGADRQLVHKVAEKWNGPLVAKLVKADGNIAAAVDAISIKQPAMVDLKAQTDDEHNAMVKVLLAGAAAERDLDSHSSIEH